MFPMLPFVRDLPITIPETLFSNACLGVITLNWSFELSPGNLIPGVIIKKLIDHLNKWSKVARFVV